MAKHNGFTVDARLATELPGRAKLRALIVARGTSVQGWARSHGFYPEQVHMTLSGARAYPEVRDAIAGDFDIPRAEVDRLIDGDSLAATPTEGAA